MPAVSGDSEGGSRPALEVFGGPVLHVAGRPVSLSPYQACLVGVVFGCREPTVTRARLLHLLWEEESPDARHRLSQLLYSFSKKLGGSELFDAGPEQVGPAALARADDLLRFERLLENEEFGRAADLLDRGFLSGLPVLPTRAFEEWLDGKRAALRAAVRNPVANRWSRHSAEEAWSPAARAATVLLRLDPHDERALRNVLWSRGMAGRVQEALAEYRSFRERREADREEEDWQPQPETRELIERLKGLGSAPLPPPELRHRIPEPEPELCGRDQELASLSRAIAAPGESPLTTVLVTGEAGIGKTRLVEEAIRGARLRGFHVLRAGSSEFERNIPLNPLLEALDDEHTGPALHRLGDPWRSVLLSLLPQFHRGDGPLPEVPYVEPGSLPRRTYEALGRLVASVVSDGPVLLFLDDFQWADETSVAAVEFLRRRWSGGRLVLVLALRGPGLARKSRAEEFAEELLASGEALHVGLQELGQDATERLIDEVAPRPVEPEERREISALAGRNPFFTVELTHEYVQGHLALRVEPGEVLPVPISIRQLLERRLEELTSDEQRILDVLAVYGHVATPDEVAGLVGRLSPEECVALIDRLQELRLIRWTGRRVAVRHELIRHTVYGRLSAGSRALQHQQVARWLLEREEASPDELALHFDRAGMEEEALRFSLEAAERAEASGAVPEAVRFLTTARRNTDDPTEAAEIVGRLGHLHYLHRNFTEAAPLLDLAAERYRRQDRICDALKAEVERLDALSRLELIPVQDFVQKAAEMKNEARASEEWEILAKLLDVEVHTLDREGDVEGVRRALGEAEAMVDQGSPAARCSARCTLAIDAFYRDPAIGLKYSRSAVDIAMAHALSDSLLVAVNRLTLVLMLQGLFEKDGGDKLCKDVERIADRSGDLYQRFTLHGNRGFWYVEKAEYVQARTYFDQAGKIIKDTPATAALATLHINAGECEFLARNEAQAESHFKQAESLLRAGVPNYLYTLVAAGLGLCALHKGNLSEAHRQRSRIGQDPPIWVYDPFTVLLLKGRIIERQKGPEAAGDYLDSHLKNIKNRFLTSWIKLKLEEARLRSKYNDQKAEEVAVEGQQVTSKLEFVRRSREFQRFLGT